MNTYWRLLGFAKPIEKYAIPYFFYTLFYAVFNMAVFVMIMPIVNSLFKDTAEPVTVKPEFSLTSDFLEEYLGYILYRLFGPDFDLIKVLILLAVLVIVFALLSNLFRYLGQRLIENMKITTLQRVRNAVFENVMDLHVGFFSNERKGDIISKISSDVQVVQYCVSNTLQVVFRDPFLIITYLLVMVLLSWKLTLFSALFLPVSALIIGTVVKKLRHPAKQNQEIFGDMVSTLDESISGVKIIKGYNATGYIKNKFHVINERFSTIARSMAVRQQMASPASEFMGITAAAVLLVFGGYLVMQGDMNGGSFITYLAIFTQITRPVRAFADAFANINQGIAAGDRVLGLMDEKNAIPDAPDAIELEGLEDSIEFRNVKFAYENRQVINGISFTIRKGETVALVGPSGGGKSTISDLIPRFYDVKEGQILIDGVDIRRYSSASLRRQMGLVAQETVLFNDTIEGNIRLGKREASIEEIVEAAKVANAHGFILETENGYDTNIGDRGMKLSGGQRQRLSIARAVLKNPEILILDEATSALDTESEKLVQDALDKLLKGRTSLVIAHRLSTVNHADKIIVIDQGHIAEAGTHSELMGKKGIYAKLIELQQLA